MRQRNVKDCDIILENSDKYIKDIALVQTVINSKKYEKICLEIGIGKGQFIENLAFKNPQNFYVGIELNRGVVSLACKKINRFEKANNVKLENLKIVDFNALNLTQIFKEKDLDRIYLNFSDPWPKKRHEKRRLTSDEFLKVYKTLLKDSCQIHFKTDNRFLFEYSIMNMNKNNMIFDYITLNLHEDIKNGKCEKLEANIMTEYEEKFCEKGPIYKLIARFN